MLTLKEKVELVSSSLSSIGETYKEESFLKEKYDTIRNKVLDEDLFFSDSVSEVYSSMRALDIITADYIKLLEKEVADLKDLVVGFGVGSIQHNAELMQDLVSGNM